MVIRQRSHRTRRSMIFRNNRPHVYSPSGKEERHLGICSGEMLQARRIGDPHKTAAFDLFDLKGALNCVVPNCYFRPGKFPDLALPVDVFSGDQMIGFGGQLSAAKSNAPGPVFVARCTLTFFLMRRRTGDKVSRRSRNFGRHSRYLR